MAVFAVHDTHKPVGETFVERISVASDSADLALDTWWAYSRRGRGGRVDTDRYEARPSK